MAKRIRKEYRDRGEKVPGKKQLTDASRANALAEQYVSALEYWARPHEEGVISSVLVRHILEMAREGTAPSQAPCPLVPSQASSLTTAMVRSLVEVREDGTGVMILLRVTETKYASLAPTRATLLARKPLERRFLEFKAVPSFENTDVIDFGFDFDLGARF